MNYTKSLKLTKDSSIQGCSDSIFFMDIVVVVRESSGVTVLQF